MKTLLNQIGVGGMIFIISLFFVSCKTTKEITKIETKYDSTAIRESVALRRVLKEELERFEIEKEQWESTGIVFDTQPCPDSLLTSNPVTKISFENGKLKSIEGNVRSLNQSLYEKSAEVLEAHTTIDSMAIELEKDQINVFKEESIKIKEIERKIYIWWPLIICFIIASIAEYRIGYIKKFLSLFKLIK